MVVLSDQSAVCVIRATSSARRRNRGGSTWITLASVSTEASAVPLSANLELARSATTRATASSSSSTSGGIEAPAANRYPPSMPGEASTG